jgi:N-acetylglucosamine-6-phosphate deacetylase
MGMQAYRAAQIFDGTTLRRGVLLVEGGVVAGIVDAAPAAVPVADLQGLVCPGFVDLQVNGGGGVMLRDAGTLVQMAAALARLGTTSFLPTLITDAPAQTRIAVDAVAAGGCPSVVGLHLEGPHLSVARKGAHDASLIRAMTADDLAYLCDARARVGRLMVTVAPESVSPDQIATLTRAGVVVSLGHSDCSYEVAMDCVAAGARVVTHLFNAMSQLGNRAPGLVGAALTDGRLDAGLIADGIHVHPATIRAALAAKAGPGEVFLVTDAMAVAGTEMTEFTLNGRVIHRQGGRLTLEDDTLAGADLDFATAIGVMVDVVGVPLDRALTMATRIPARVAGVAAGQLRTGDRADFVHLMGMQVQGVWRGGERLEQN